MDEFACPSKAAEHLVGVLRYSQVRNLSMNFDFFNNAWSEALIDLFKSLRAEIISVRFPDGSVDIMPCLQALDIKHHLVIVAPAAQGSEHLFAAIVPLKLSYVVVDVKYSEERRAHDVMDDAIVAYLFQQHDGSHLKTNATVSSAFLGKLLKKFHETPASALPSVSAQIDCPQQVIPVDFPHKRSDGFGRQVAYVWTKDLPRRRSTLNVDYRTWPHRYSIELNDYKATV